LFQTGFNSGNDCFYDFNAGEILIICRYNRPGGDGGASTGYHVINCHMVEGLFFSIAPIFIGEFMLTIGVILALVEAI
jgi:hypothetical protein